MMTLLEAISPTARALLNLNKTKNMNLPDIQSLTEKYSKSHAALGDAVQVLLDTIESVKRQHLPQIKKLVAVAAERKENLRAAIEGNPQLFDSPKTVVFHGIKVGLRKGSGKVTWDDDEQVIKLIEKHLADEADLLIKTSKTLRKKAISDLDVASLKKIGCTVESTGDVVVIKPVDSEVEKAVSSLLAAASEEAKEEAA